MRQHDQANISVTLTFVLLGLAVLLLFSLDLLLGSTRLDVSDIFRSLFGEGTAHGEIIVMQFRLPKAV
ncbi:MAG: hypothetical protein IH593_04200, partial [Bacteroidales bacterium]|nr:hypothetical protein [Bacteroidales bacterium]